MDPDASIASWALRWVGSHSNVKVILSGMSTEEMCIRDRHYVLEGETKIQLNQEIVSARKGSLVIANSNVLHAGFSEETGGAMLVMIFEMGALSGELAEKNIIFQPIIRDDERIGELMRQIYEEQEKRETGWKLACKRCV